MLYYFDKYFRHAFIIFVTRTGISNIIVREELQYELNKNIDLDTFNQIIFS